MKTSWQNQPERGSSALIRFIAWLSLVTDRRVGRLLLYPICTYFFLSSSVARAASRQYLTKVFQRPAHLGQVFKHYLTFAQVTLDRVFLLAGRLDLFDITIEGQEVIEAQLAKNQGFLFLGAHLGSFEVLRALGTQERQMPIKIMMYPDNSQRIMTILAALNPELAEATIPLGRPNTMLSAKQHLDSGGIIGLLGDRITSGDKTVCSSLLGSPAQFPAGPILLASILKVPVILFHGLYRGGSRYDVRFELFSEEIAIESATRQQDLQLWVDRYAARLDHFCHSGPYNWFNFYDFWRSPEGPANTKG